MVDTILSCLDRDLVTIMAENLSKHKIGNEQLHTLRCLKERWRGSKTMECSLMFCQTIYSDCQSSPVMSDVDNIFVTRGSVVFYGASCITRTLRVRGGAGSAVVSSSDMVTARRTIRNRIFYPGPFLDYQCFHQSL